MVPPPAAKKAAKTAKKSAPAKKAAAPETGPPAMAPPPAAVARMPMSPEQEKQWAMFTHLSALSGLVIGLGWFLGPLILWIVKKDESAFVDRHGRSALNFQFTMLIAAVVSAILILVIIGIFLLIAVIVVDIVFTVIATMKANNGEEYTYPMSIRFFKAPAA